MPIAVAQFDSVRRVILVVTAVEVFEMGMGYLVEPKVLGGGVDLRPVAVLLAIGFWSLVWGIVGARAHAEISPTPIRNIPITHGAVDGLRWEVSGAKATSNDRSLWELPDRMDSWSRHETKHPVD